MGKEGTRQMMTMAKSSLFKATAAKLQVSVNNLQVVEWLLEVDGDEEDEGHHRYDKEVVIRMVEEDLSRHQV